VLAFLLLGPFSIQPSPAQKIFTKFAVCYINTTPKESPQGQIIVVIFGVFYSDYSPCGDACELKAIPGQSGPTGSFMVMGSPALRYIDIPVTSTGKPGEYRAELRWPPDAPIGKQTAYIVQDSLYDGKSTGPVQDTSYLETPDPIDNSEFTSRSANPVVAMFDFLPRDIVVTALTVGTFMTFGIMLAELLERYFEDLFQNLLQKSGQNLIQRLLGKNPRAQRFVQRLLRRRAPPVSAGGHLGRLLSYEAITSSISFVIVFFVLRHLLSSLAFGEIRSDIISSIAGAIVSWLLSRSGLYKPLQRRLGLVG